MEIRYYIHVTHDPEISVLLREVLDKLDSILWNQEIVMATVNENLDIAEKSMKANSDYEDSMIIGLEAIRKEVEALKQSGTDPGTAKRIEDLASALQARTPVLAAAAAHGVESKSDVEPSPVVEPSPSESGVSG